MPRRNDLVTQNLSALRLPCPRSQALLGNACLAKLRFTSIGGRWGRVRSRASHDQCSQAELGNEGLIEGRAGRPDAVFLLPPRGEPDAPAREGTASLAGASGSPRRRRRKGVQTLSGR